MTSLYKLPTSIGGIFIWFMTKIYISRNYYKVKVKYGYM